MRVLLKIQAIQWVLLAITARILGSVYFKFELQNTSYPSLLFMTIAAALLGVWSIHIFKMKKQISIRSGSKTAQLHTSRFILNTFEGKNIQNAIGVDAFKAIPVSNFFFNFLKRISRVQHFDIHTAKVIQKKDSQNNFRYLQMHNRFYLIPDSETQIALVGYNGNKPATKIDNNLVEKNTTAELLSVKRWAAYPVKEVAPKKTVNRIKSKTVIAKKSKPATKSKRVVKTSGKKTTAKAKR